MYPSKFKILFLLLCSGRGAKRDPWTDRNTKVPSSYKTGPLKTKGNGCAAPPANATTDGRSERTTTRSLLRPGRRGLCLAMKPSSLERNGRLAGPLVRKCDPLLVPPRRGALFYCPPPVPLHSKPVLRAPRPALHCGPWRRPARCRQRLLQLMTHDIWPGLTRATCQLSNGFYHYSHYTLVHCKAHFTSIYTLPALDRPQSML